MAAGLNVWPTAHLRFGGRSERLLEPTRDRGMKLKAMHEKNATTNLPAAPRFVMPSRARKFAIEDGFQKEL